MQLELRLKYLQWIIALEINTCKYVQIFKRITQNVYWKSVYILIVEVSCNKRNLFSIKSESDIVYDFVLSFYTNDNVQKKKEYRITNKLLLNLIYMYAHFIKLIRSPDYVLELDVIFYNVTL